MDRRLRDLLSLTPLHEYVRHVEEDFRRRKSEELQWEKLKSELSKSMLDQITIDQFLETPRSTPRVSKSGR